VGDCWKNSVNPNCNTGLNETSDLINMELCLETRNGVTQVIPHRWDKEVDWYIEVIKPY
jgi:hypothetical protein